MNMRMDAESEFKVMLNRITGVVGRETVLNVGHELIDDGTTDFTFYGTNFGQVTINLRDKDIKKLGERVLLQHLRHIRTAILDAENRTTKFYIQQDFKDE